MRGPERGGWRAGSARAEPEYLYGRNPVLEALRAGRRVYRLYVAEGAHGAPLQDLAAIARERGIPLAAVDRHRLDQVAGEHHQGVVAEVEPYVYCHPRDLLHAAAERGEPPLLLALDSLQDPQNFGTLLRAALATGAHGVLIPEHRSVSVTAAVSKASAGAVEHLAVARAPNLVRTLLALKQEGVWVYGLALGGPQPFWEIDWTTPSAVVVGAEGTGLGRLTRETCDVLVRIPMAPHAPESLNAATAGALVLYEAFRQRQGTKD